MILGFLTIETDSNGRSKLQEKQDSLPLEEIAFIQSSWANVYTGGICVFFGFDGNNKAKSPIKGKPEWKDIELDMVAESLDHSTILIGECKWTTGENGRLLTNGINKIVPSLPFVDGKKVVVKLFTKVRPDDDQGNSLLPEDVLRLFY